MKKAVFIILIMAIIIGIIIYNKKKNGELIWESAMISALKNDKGEIMNYMAIQEDITQKKKTERKLKDRTEQLLSLINNTPDLIVFKNKDEKRSKKNIQRHYKNCQSIK